MSDSTLSDTPPSPTTYTADIESFLSFLAGATGDKEVFTYALMDMESESVIPGYGVQHDKLDGILNIGFEEGATLHVCLNRTNLRGRKTSDMVSARVLCCDLDTPTSKERMGEIVRLYRPGLIVESSPSKYHLYWKIDSSIPLRVWSDLQLGLAELLGGDYALAQVTHTIRVPGVVRLCKNGSVFLPRRVYQPEITEPELPQGEILSRFSGIEEAKTRAETKIKEQNKAIKTAIKRTRSGKSIDLKAASQVGRNSYLYHYLKEWAAPAKTLNLADFLTIAEHINNQFPEPLSAEEVGAITKKAFKKWEATCEWKEEKKAEKEKILNQLVIQSPIAENGAYVNGASGSNGNGTAHASMTPGEFPYDYSVPRLKNSRISDSGLVERIAQRFKGDLIKCGGVTYAFKESSRLWSPQSLTMGTQIIRGMALKCADDLCADPVIIELCSDKDGVDTGKVLREQQKWHSHRSINGAVGGLLNEEQIRNEIAAIFDAKTMCFYAANGVVDMNTGAIRDAVSEDYMLKRSPVVYDENASYSWWVDFLDQVFANNPNKIEELAYLQEVFGYALTGCVEEQKIFIHTGEGSNGKSRVISALNALCGDYATRLSSDSLSKSKNAVVREIQRIGAKIEGKRAVIIDDLDSKTQWNDAFLKALTEDILLVRNLYHEEREIPNRSKIHICCNDIPIPEKGNEALYRRLAILDYSRKFEVDPYKAREIKENIQANLSGILNWALEGFQRVTSQGGKIKYPKSVEFRMQTYREATSEMGNSYVELTKRFSKELAAKMLELDPDDLANDQHWHSLEELAEESGASKDVLGKILTQHGFLKAQKRKFGKTRPIGYFVIVE